MKVTVFTCKQGYVFTVHFLFKCRRLNLLLDTQLEHLEGEKKEGVHPVLLYGCEIWAYENMDVVSKLQHRFLKLILGVKFTTPTQMVLGKVGRYLTDSMEAKCRIFGFCYDLCSTSYSELPTISNLMNGYEYKLSWLMEVTG